MIVGNGMGSSMPVFEDTCIREWERRSSPPRDFQIAEQYYLDVRKDIVLGTLVHQSRINSTTCSVQQGIDSSPSRQTSVTEEAEVKPNQKVKKNKRNFHYTLRDCGVVSECISYIRMREVKNLLRTRDFRISGI